MFGKNEIVGKKYFENAASDTLFVTSMFMTLQGEGPYSGEPAFFIRLAKCNLNCSFCDTFFDDGDWLTFAEIEQRIEDTIGNFYAKKKLERPLWTSHAANKKKNMVLVVTGGEPTLQANLGPFLTRMNSIFRNTQIESNGIAHQPSIPLATTIVISPKCNERNGVAIKYLTPHKENLKIADCLKFVMTADAESQYNSVPEWAHKWAADTGKPIYVSPMNIYNNLPSKAKELRTTLKNRIEIDDRESEEVISFWEEGLLNMPENQRNHEYAAQYCVQHGFVLNLQIHLYASLA